VNQIQLNPRITRPEHQIYDREHGIVTVAWSPLGARSDLLDDPTLKGLAEKYGKTPAQIILRWDIQQGLVPIPRSSNPQRLAQNIDIFDFTLSDADMAAISALDTGEHPRADSDTQGH
jgi:2,5-diketo-D-gluconate reductase A